jgi:putative transcriptional regulator
MNAMMRVRLKADGRLVEVLADGSERAIVRTEDARPATADDLTADALAVGAAAVGAPVAAASSSANPRAGGGQGSDAVYAKGIRARAKLTQAEFAARIGVPIETVRNWEQGKRSPRGPARALLKMIDQAPQVAFAVLNSGKTER